jgi:hypothetical protein
MSVWGRIFAAGNDHLMSGPEKATLRADRQVLIPKARGRALEIGGGTGANLPFYEDIETLTLTEPDKPMVHRLGDSRAGGHVVPLSLSSRDVHLAGITDFPAKRGQQGSRRLLI